MPFQTASIRRIMYFKEHVLLDDTAHSSCYYSIWALYVSPGCKYAHFTAAVTYCYTNHIYIDSLKAIFLLQHANLALLSAFSFSAPVFFFFYRSTVKFM